MDLRRLAPLARPRAWVLTSAGLLVGLALTGAWQTWHYRPDRRRSATQSWDDIYTLHAASRPSGQGAGWASALHRGLASLIVLAVIALVVTILVAAARRARLDPWLLVAGGGAGVGALVAVATGRRLPWESLALWAVRIDSGVDGVWGTAFGDNVRFVVLDGREVSLGAYRSALVQHLLVPVLIGACLFVVHRRLRQPDGGAGDDDGSVSG